jgi:hypothetical protein
VLQVSVLAITTNRRANVEEGINVENIERSTMKGQTNLQNLNVGVVPSPRYGVHVITSQVCGWANTRCSAKLKYTATLVVLRRSRCSAAQAACSASKRSTGPRSGSFTRQLARQLPRLTNLHCNRGKWEPRLSKENLNDVYRLLCSIRCLPHLAGSYDNHRWFCSWPPTLRFTIRISPLTFQIAGHHIHRLISPWPRRHERTAFRETVGIPPFGRHTMTIILLAPIPRTQAHSLSTLPPI